MRYDRQPHHPAVIVQTPAGTIYELDVRLSHEEIAVLTGGRLMPSTHRIYEPWLRITDGADVETSAGIEIVDNDDGA